MPAPGVLWLAARGQQVLWVSASRWLAGWLPPLADALHPRRRRKKDHGRAEAMLLAAWGLGTRAEVIASSLPAAALSEEETEGEDAGEDAEWEAAFAELEGWRVGNLDAAWPVATETLLGTWIKRQRQQYKAMVAGNAARAGGMTATLAARLEGLPSWEWAPRRGGSRRGSGSGNPKLEGTQPADPSGPETPG